MRALPFLLCLVAVGVLTLMNALIKGLTPHYDIFQISFLRYVTGSVWIGLIVLYVRPIWPERRHLPAHVARGVLGAISGTAFFFALREIALADAFTIAFLAPLFVTLLSLFFLREKPRLSDLAALALGFGGMLLIISGPGPGGAARSLFGIGAAIVSALTYAVTLVMLRRMAQRDAVVLLVLFQHVVSAVTLAPIAITNWTPMPAPHLILLGLGALLGVLGHLMMAKAYSGAPAARLAPLEYSALLYAGAIDFIWFGQVLQRDTLLGAVLIICGAVLATRR